MVPWLHLVLGSVTPLASRTLLPPDSLSFLLYSSPFLLSYNEILERSTPHAIRGCQDTKRTLFLLSEKFITRIRPYHILELILRNSFWDVWDLGSTLISDDLVSLPLSSGQWHGTWWDSGSCCSCSNWSHSLFFETAPSTCNLPTEHTWSAERKGCKGEGGQLAGHWPSTSCCCCCTRSPFLPFFHKTFCTASDQTWIWLRNKDGQAIAKNIWLPAVSHSEDASDFYNSSLISCCCCLLLHSPTLPMYSDFQSKPTACNAQMSLELLLVFNCLMTHWQVSRSLTAKLSHKRPTCQTRPEIHPWRSNDSI